MPINVYCIACSVFRREMEALSLRRCWPFEIRWLDSVLHLYPERLHRAIDATMADLGERKILLLFGDCHAYMVDAARKKHVARVHGINCCEVFLGTEAYRYYRREGAFFLLPEWAARWREILPVALGLRDAEVKSMMAEAHTHLRYLDTGLQPVPTRALEEASAYTGLPCHVATVGLEHLQAAVDAALQALL